jgi:hypothetical protein
MIENINEFVTVSTTVLLGVQALVNYILPPEKAQKFNVIGKILDFLTKTKAGLSGSTK